MLKIRLNSAFKANFSEFCKVWHRKPDISIWKCAARFLKSHPRFQDISNEWLQSLNCQLFTFNLTMDSLFILLSFCTLHSNMTKKNVCTQTYMWWVILIEYKVARCFAISGCVCCTSMFFHACLYYHVFTVVYLPLPINWEKPAAFFCSCLVVLVLLRSLPIYEYSL